MNTVVTVNSDSAVTNRSLDFYKKGMFGDYLGITGLTEIAVNRPGGAFLKIHGEWSFVENPKITLAACERFGKTLAKYNDDDISDTKPVLSATLESRERVQAVCYPACERGTYSITIRVPTDQQIPHQKYIDGGFYSQIALEKKESVDEQRLRNLYKHKRIDEFMELAVKMGKTIVFAGATGSGKTTYMKTLMAFVPDYVRIITIEDTPEIKFWTHKNYVHLFYPSEASNTPGAIVTSASLLKSCFRMNPDRIFLAEVRGGETWDFYKVVSSGHGGSMTSIHSGSVEEAIDGLIERCYQNTECQMLPYAVLRRKILNSTDIICHVDVSGDVRRMGEIYFKAFDQERYLAA
ncbi:P-type DNA transfer ATPase VirB11 [Pseudomonas amygdali]|uniref:P-type DNA transfer ATPase VirB11 n=1 Tax=Pseudomonas amygdali TaxID=47877 RepID=UPI000B1FAC7B|nr:P-type DNA transfer ATPase VirB11 [Pseudomonas amygdali]